MITMASIVNKASGAQNNMRLQLNKEATQHSVLFKVDLPDNAGWVLD